MANSLAVVRESAVAKSVTSWPRATSPSVSSEVIVSTDPDFGGGMVVATGAMCAILMSRHRSHDGLSRRHERHQGSRTGHLEQPRQHDARVEALARDLG